MTVRDSDILDTLNTLASAVRLACSESKDLPGRWTAVPKHRLARIEILLEVLDTQVEKARKVPALPEDPS